MCCYQSPQIGWVFVTVNSVNSVNILSFFPPGSALCVSLHGASIFSYHDALLLLRQFVIRAVNFVICAVNFLYFRTRYCGVILVFFGGSCSEPTLWDSGAEFVPFLQARSSHFVGRYFLLAIFDGDNSIPNSILRGFLTATLIHITLEFHSLLIRTTRHFTLLRRR